MNNINPVMKILDHLPLPSFVLHEGNIKVANVKMALLTECSLEDLNNVPFEEFIHPSERARVIKEMLSCQTNKDFSKQFEFTAVTRNGRQLYLQCAFNPYDPETLLVQLIDLTEQKLTEQSLKASNLQYKEIIDSIHEVVFEADISGNLVFANQKAYEFFSYQKDFPIYNFNIMQAIIPEDHPRASENIAKIYRGEDLGLTEYTARRADGTTFPVIIHSFPIFSNGNPIGLRGIIVDISERKQAEDKMKFMSLHDSLTGLYNRACFEQELQRLHSENHLPIGILVCDVDGLKLVNDTLGHDKGDSLLLAATSVITQAVRKKDLVARIGGDEFAILLSCSDEPEVVYVRKRIYHNIEQYNLAHPELILSISVGYAFGEASTDLSILFKEADNNMYREKLHRKQSARSSIVKTLLKALDERDFITQGHAERLKDMAVNVAIHVGLPEHKLNDISLFAQFHDIGKVGIPDHLLFKPGHLTPEELIKMREHSEIGYRIAMSTPDLAPIAHLILNHHEWWNGQGYPEGLKGEEIPLDCRILSICDAFDAMTNDRPYRQALSHKKAIEELQRKAGIQFDADLVKSFIQVITEKYK